MEQNRQHKIAASAGVTLATKEGSLAATKQPNSKTENNKKQCVVKSPQSPIDVFADASGARCVASCGNSAGEPKPTNGAHVAPLDGVPVPPDPRRLMDDELLRQYHAVEDALAREKDEAGPADDEPVGDVFEGFYDEPQRQAADAGKSSQRPSDGHGGGNREPPKDAPVGPPPGDEEPEDEDLFGEHGEWRSELATDDEHSFTIVMAHGTVLVKTIGVNEQGQHYVAATYGNAKFYRARPVDMRSLDEIEANLRSISTMPKWALVPGAILDTADRDQMRRVKNEKPNVLSTLKEVRRKLIVLDFEITQRHVPKELDRADLTACARFAMSFLPSCFHGCACIVLATNSHMVSEGVRLRFFFLADRALLYRDELKVWLEEEQRGWKLLYKDDNSYGKPPVDTSPTNAAGLHYTGAPVFVNGATDPLPNGRIIRLDGESMVHVPSEEWFEELRAPKQEKKRERARDDSGPHKSASGTHKPITIEEGKRIYREMRREHGRFEEHDEWRDGGMAAKLYWGEAGKAVWAEAHYTPEEWAAYLKFKKLPPAAYSQFLELVDYKWNSFATEMQGGVTIASIIMLAREDGVYVPSASDYDPERDYEPPEQDTIFAKEAKEAKEEKSERKKPKIKKLSKLAHQEFPDVRYIVPGFVPEGLLLLAGKPKMGKSWLTLQILLAIATGGSTLGVQCEQGDVLYLALEDNERRLKKRVKQMRGWDEDDDWPDAFEYATEWQRAEEGGLQDVYEWLEAHKDTARAVAIDVHASFRSGRKISDTQYEGDYKSLRALQKLAARYRVAIIVVHHTRKSPGVDDPFEEISGTYGIVGAADTASVLRNSNTGPTFYLRGRDIEEKEVAVHFDKSVCNWIVRGDPAVVRLSTERKQVIKALFEAGDEGATPKELASETRMKVDNVKFLLRKLVETGEAEKIARGRYRYSGGARAE